MRHDWVLDVLTDLQRFAEANRLDHLAEQLALAHRIAQTDIASSGREVHVNTNGKHGAAGHDPRGNGGMYGT